MTSHLRKIENNGTFDDVVSGALPEVQAIAREARKMVANLLPELTEVPWAKQKTVGYGVGPKKMSEHFCYLAPQSNYLNIGFFYGAELDDPDGLLEGTGKLLRHIKVRSLEGLRNPAILKLLRQASRYLPRLDNP